MEINSKALALLDLTLAITTFQASRNEVGLVKTGLQVATLYLLLGSYMNSQGRIKVLESKQ